jgi:hypothetical protein
MTHRAPRVLASAIVLTLLVACAPAQVRYGTVAPPPPTSAPRATLFLVGDAGEINPHSTAVLDHLRESVSSAVRQGTGPVVVVFLGDNLYELGASAGTENDIEILQAQVDALGTDSRVQGVFIPGNHDWSDGGADELGRRAVRLQRDWISRLGATSNVRLLPADACPGPATLDVDSSIHLVFVDTEWLLRQPVDDCGGVDGFFGRLEEDLTSNRERQVVVLSHHPLASGGPHAGHVALFERGPFLWYLLKKSGVNVQDLGSARYSAMIRRFEQAFESSGVRPLFQASGHDHSLQVIRLAGPGQPAYQLVSGAGSRSTNSRRIAGTRFATNGYGYMRVDFHDSGPRVSVYVRALDGGAVRPTFTCLLASADASDTCTEAPMIAGGP